MKISQKLILVVLVNSLIPLLGVGLFSYNNTQKALTDQIQIRLGETADYQAQRIKTALDLTSSRSLILSSRVQIRLLLDQYNKAGGTALRQQMSTALTLVSQEYSSVEHIHLLNTQGIVVASSDSLAVGNSYSKQEVYLKGRQANTTALFFKNRAGELRQYWAAPLTLDGRPIGVMIVENRVESFLSVTGDYSRLGKTGESYLVRRLDQGSTQYLTPLRYQADAALKSAPNTLSPAADYRRQPVLSAHRELSDGWSLIAKIDKAEVNGPLVAQGNATIAILIVVSLLVIFSAWYLARFITIPIRRLTDTATKIREDNLDLRVDIKSHDEIGLLGAAFNEMTTSLLDSRARLTASITSLPFGFGIVDDQNRILFSNPLLGKLCGHAVPTDPDQSQAVLARIGRDFSHAIDILGLIAEAQTKRQPIEKNIEYGPLFFRFFFAPIIAEDGHVLGTVVIVENITERMAMERSRDEFFSIASHELRTPLTAVRGNSDMILDYYKDQIKDPDLHAMVTDIHDASIRLINIVNDFLDLSSLEQGRVALKPEVFDLRELIAQVMREFDVTGSRRMLKLSLLPTRGVLPPIFADRTRTRQIVVNLLANATKHTHEGSVTFELTHTTRSMQVTIADTGSGIPVESQHLLFRKFQQVAASILTREDTQSTGLGLYICKLLCENMGGKIKLVRSKVGQGSVFAFTLPLATPARIKKQSVSDKN